jgi:hypothetical protein
MAIDLTTPSRSAPRTRFAVAAFIVASTALAGCETTSALLPGATVATPTTAPPADQIALQPAPVQPKAALPKVAVYPVLAAPDPLNRQIQTDLAAAIDTSRFAVVTVTDNSTPQADYHLRGYATAARDKSGAKLSYFFDVTDAAGRRLRRIAGDAPLQAATAKGKDVWPAVTADVVKSVATRTATQFAATADSGGAVAAAPAAGGSTAVAQAPGALAANTPAADPSQPPATATAATPTTSASRAVATPADLPPAPTKPTGPVTVAVAPVTGAPGDGGKSLTAALKTELKKQGLTVVEGNAPTTYKVQGQVSLSPSDTGGETIKIAWDVKDGGGNKLATVSQGNTIEKGALNGAWGPTANDIAAAATAAIIPLLKKPEASATALPGRQAAAQADSQIR